MDTLHRIAEIRIREAIERGELDDLPGRGKPLALEDLSRVPPDLRMGFLVLRRAGVLPEELELRKELITLDDLISACENDDERRKLCRKKNERWLRYRMILERRLHGSVRGRYERKIRRRLGI